jgi:hypothetical protein
MWYPEGLLSRGDAFAKVRRDLFENYNVHTIISLPAGVFANAAASGQGPILKVHCRTLGQFVPGLPFYQVERLIN